MGTAFADPPPSQYGAKTPRGPYWESRARSVWGAGRAIVSEPSMAVHVAQRTTSRWAKSIARRNRPEGPPAVDIAEEACRYFALFAPSMRWVPPNRPLGGGARSSEISRGRYAQRPIALDGCFPRETLLFQSATQSIRGDADRRWRISGRTTGWFERATGRLLAKTPYDKARPTGREYDRTEPTRPPAKYREP